MIMQVNTCEHCLSQLLGADCPKRPFPHPYNLYLRDSESVDQPSISLWLRILMIEMLDMSPQSAATRDRCKIPALPFESASRRSIGVQHAADLKWKILNLVFDVAAVHEPGHGVSKSPGQQRQFKPCIGRVSWLARRRVRQ